MKNWISICILVAVAAGLWFSGRLAYRQASIPEHFRGRSEVLFWHFWGGADRDVVDDVVLRFNQSQSEYYVRAIAVPGNNLEAKLFLSIAGGDPPDLVNQDDPIVGDWGARGAIEPVDTFATQDELKQLERFLFPAARSLGSYRNRLYAICNGLDIRALYYNQTELERFGLQPPRTIDELNHIAQTISPPDSTTNPDYFAYLPDSRRLWAWGYVFGGKFYDERSSQVLLDSQPIQQATQWIAQFGRWYGSDTINAFRRGDQSLPGKTFPLLPVENDAMVGRYVLMMDGQWRTRDIDAFTRRRAELGLPAPTFGVCPLPFPTEGAPDAGWVNGNFFVVPRGAKNPRGAMAFMKFWIGLDDPQQAAVTCAQGGWIPVSQSVVDDLEFQSFLRRQPLFSEFVRLAASPNQHPVPVIPGALFLKRTVEHTAEAAISNPEQSIEQLLQRADARIQQRLDEMSHALR